MILNRKHSWNWANGNKFFMVCNITWDTMICFKENSAFTLFSIVFYIYYIINYKSICYLSGEIDLNLGFITVIIQFNISSLDSLFLYRVLVSSSNWISYAEFVFWTGKLVVLNMRWCNFMWHKLSCLIDWKFLVFGCVGRGFWVNGIRLGEMLEIDKKRE